jgi:hypothetical protein
MNLYRMVDRTILERQGCCDGDDASLARLRLLFSLS